MEAGLGIILFGLSVEDYLKKEINIYGIFLELAFAIGIFLFQEIEIWNLLGGVGFGMVIMGFGIFTKGKIGIGDGIVLSILGMALGIIPVFQIFLLALLFSGVFSGIMLCMGRYSWKSTIPFIPFITLGYIGVMFC